MEEKEIYLPSTLDKLLFGVFFTQLKFLKKQFKLNGVNTQIPVFLAPIHKTGYPKKNPDTQLNEKWVVKIAQNTQLLKILSEPLFT